MNTGSESAGRWEEAIRAFEKEDEQRGYHVNGVVFTGSSTVRLWESLEKSFAAYGVINRGFGGASVDEVRQYVPRTVTPHRPRMVCVYAGGNDIAMGRKAEAVFAGLVRTIDACRLKRDTTVGVFTVLYHPKFERWHAEILALNEMLGTHAEARERVLVMDAALAIQRAADQGRTVFRADGIHLNENGYAVLNELVDGRLQEAER